MLEPDDGPGAVCALDLHVGHVEQNGPLVGQSRRHEILDDLMLGIHGDSLAGQGAQINALTAAVEAQFEAVMNEALAKHAFAQPGFHQEVHRNLFKDAGANGGLDVLPAARLDQHRFDADSVQQMRQHEPGRACTNYSHLCAHRPLLVGRVHRCSSRPMLLQGAGRTILTSACRPTHEMPLRRATFLYTANHCGAVFTPATGCTIRPPQHVGVARRVIEIREPIPR